MFQFLIYSLRIRRVEYRVAEIPILMIPVLLTIGEAHELVTLTFWEGAFAFFFLFAFGDLVNCLADRDLDAEYKPHLSAAVYGLGIRNVILQAAASALAALALTVHIAWQLDRWFLVPALIMGLLLAWAYSVPPFRLKSRGLWQIAFYWWGLFAGPMIFAAWIISSHPPTEVYLIALAYGLLQTGVILVNTAEDYPEDQAAEVRTAIVALGLRRGITVSFVLTILGSLWLLASLGWISWRQSTSSLVFLLVILVVAASCLFAVFGIWRLRRGLSAADDREDAAAVKASGKLVPIWITSNALATLLAAFVVFLVS